MIRAFSATISVLIMFIGGFSQASYREDELAINFGFLTPMAIVDSTNLWLWGNMKPIMMPIPSIDLLYKHIEYLDTDKSCCIGLGLGGIVNYLTGLSFIPELYIKKTWSSNLNNDYFFKEIGADISATATTLGGSVVALQI